LFLYGVGFSIGYPGAGVFEYSGNLLCLVSKVCERDPFLLFVSIFFGVTLVRYGVVV
jgi:hypothetical protein